MQMAYLGFFIFGHCKATQHFVFLSYSKLVDRNSCRARWFELAGRGGGILRTFLFTFFLFLSFLFTSFLFTSFLLTSFFLASFFLASFFLASFLLIPFLLVFFLFAFFSRWTATVIKTENILVFTSLSSL